MYKNFLKRLFDIVFSLVALAILSPVLVFFAIAIWLEDRHSPIFLQQRVGKNKNLFTLYKFRSMPVGTRNVPSNRVEEIKITRCGRIIRRLNIDELPQLLNILKGEMSFVGPRPILPTQDMLIQLRQERGVFTLTPGLTGLPQVEAYDGMPLLEKAELDRKYSQKLSFSFDCWIILRTFFYLFRTPPTDE